MQHAPYCHLWPALLCNIFSTLSHFLLWGGRGELLNIKCVFRVAHNFGLIYYLFLEEMSKIRSKTYIGHYVKSTIYSCPILTKLELSWQIFEKSSDFKFHENPSSGSRVAWGWMVGQTDTMKLIVALHSFVNTPKNWCLVTFVYLMCKPFCAGSDRKGKLRVQQEHRTGCEVTNWTVRSVIEVARYMKVHSRWDYSTVIPRLTSDPANEFFG